MEGRLRLPPNTNGSCHLPPKTTSDRGTGLKSFLGDSGEELT